MMYTIQQMKGMLTVLSNNVEIAFGADADGDGVLASRETRLVVGWDCGSWFVQQGESFSVQFLSESFTVILR